MRLEAWALAAAIAAASPARAAEALLQTADAPACRTVDLSAAQMDCTSSQCRLTGQVEIRCGNTVLWGNQATVSFDRDGNFTGAEAARGAIVVEGNSVLYCQTLTLGPDHIQGEVEGATVLIKRQMPRPPVTAIPQGRDAAVFHGDVRRTGPKTLHIENADFTMCDCGEDPPSWRLVGKSVDATLDERATVWWPRLYINPFGLGLVPITPPLLPLSVPLKHRAMGFLPPQLTFLTPPWPMIDLPFFVPLGQSWDVTLIPGLRMDWGSHRLTPPSAWGAPRLGGRLRYAPTESTTGELRTDWTMDRKHWGAKSRKIPTPGPPPEGPTLSATEQAIWDLVDRVAVSWQNRTEIGSRTDWLTTIDWLSDDYLLQDFRVSLSEQATSYLPSRTELYWRHPQATALLAGDYLLNLRSGATELSNVYGGERATGNRGPFLGLRLNPVSLAGGLQANAESSFVRYGPWTAVPPSPLVVGGGRVGLAYRDAIGPASLSARAELDGVWLDGLRGKRDVKLAWSQSRGTASAGNIQALFEASARTSVARNFGSFTHLITPQVVYRSVPWLDSSLEKNFEAAGGESLEALDERLLRRKFDQASAGVEQSLWTRGSGGPEKRASLVVTEIWDVGSGLSLGTQMALAGWLPPYASARLSMSLAPDDLRRATEIGAQVGVTRGPVDLSASYLRLEPGAERPRRSLYELAAPRLPPGPIWLGDQARWTSRGAFAVARQPVNAVVHVLSFGAGLRWGTRLSASYATDFLLGVRDEPDRGTLNAHQAALSYRSPCDCWGVTVAASMPVLARTLAEEQNARFEARGDPTRVEIPGPRFQVLLDLAGYRLGM